MRQAILTILSLLAWTGAGADDLAECAVLDNEVERLQCYDAISGRAAAKHASATAARPAERSPWERRLFTEAAREPHTLTTYQPTYVMFTHLRSFNDAPYRAIEDRLRQEEIKLNLSMQTKIADDLLGDNGDVWLAYTQTAYWQFFAEAISAPFRETNHNPEARISFLTDYRLPAVTLRDVSFGITHDSNGQAQPLSRSWNRLFAQLQFVRGNLGVSVRPWVRIFDVDDNPDIEDYYGNFELRVSWERSDHLFAAMVRDPSDHRYGAELSWSFPIVGRMRGLVQWYYGYGENLIDYNHKNNRIGVGILMSDWL